MGERRGVIAKFCWEIEGKRPLGRPRHRWEDNIKMDLQAQGGGGREHGRDQSGSGKGQTVGSCECSNSSLGSIKFVEFLE